LETTGVSRNGNGGDRDRQGSVDGSKDLPPRNRADADAVADVMGRYMLAVTESVMESVGR
jgi:hypothetical protein